MACRCTEIGEYEDDIKVLDEIIDKGDELKKLMYKIHSEISDLKGYYCNTVYATDELKTAFDNLDRGKAYSVAAITGRANLAKDSAMKKLKILRDEDDAWDGEHTV